jgi:Protein of unknown function, DUF255
MWTTSCLFALLVSGALNPAPSWNHDYAQALTQAQAAKKPVAVFIGSGADGWKAVCEDGKPSFAVRRLLADRYVCVYVDADHPAQESLARSFEAGKSPMVVLSSQNHRYQAYRHSGKLTNASLAGALGRHATGDTWEPYNDPAVIRPVADLSSEVYSFATPCRT